MDPNSVLGKTQKGKREIETRENKLDHRLRTLLIMVNGRATAGELGKQFAQIAEISTLLEQLLAQGYVEAAGGTPATAAVGVGNLKHAQSTLCMHLSNALGPDADAITAKIESFKTLEDLRAYLEKQRPFLEEWLGKGRSAEFWAKANPLLR